MNVMFEWALQFVNGMSYIWNWLITPIDIFNQWFNVDIAPIYLVVGSACIIGLVRRLI